MDSKVFNVPIKQLQPSEYGPWDAYVHEHPKASFFHLSGWKRVIEEVYGHRSYFLYAEADGRVLGVLPLAHIRSRLFSNALISTPFCVYGGVLADTPEVADALVEHACGLANDLQVDYLELRNLDTKPIGWPENDLYVTFRKTLEPDLEANLENIPRKQRAVVRKGISAGLRSELDADTTRFYRIYSESVRNLGTPVFPARYFKALKQIFGPQCDVLTVTQNGLALSSVMSFYFRHEVLPYYGGGTRQARELKANDFMYWELMRRAVAKGIRIFDFGRSKRGTGSFSFKRNWGFEATPLHYEYFLVKSREIPDINPMNPKYTALIALWQRLPLPVSRLLGPM
ncbi:MAG: FemAB family XrtA/PEP-CTERM system-associated protein, partial [Gammaproteobacteria bacterium]